MFAGWNSWKSFAELHRPAHITTTDLDYSVVEIGDVIRQSTRPNAVVLLAEGDQSLSLWYYADRPLRYQVWDPSALRKRIDDGSSDLCFGISERHRGRALVLVFPKAYQSTVPEFGSYLHARYPSHDAGKFVVFTLPQQRN
jgi:hypothetical protein